MEDQWYQSIILKGTQVGRTMSYPTINLDPTALPPNTKPGVYAAWVTISALDDAPTPPSLPSSRPASPLAPPPLAGALFFGPRLVFNETHNVLEIYLLEFSQLVYNQTASFKLVSFIRPPQAFVSTEELQRQIGLDVQAVRSALKTEPSPL